MADFERVGRIGDAINGRLVGECDGRPVLLIRLEDRWYGVEDVCSHDGQPMTDGAVEGCALECPRHGARFDLQTGAPLCMPAVEPIAVFEVQQRDQELWARRR